MTLRKSFYHMCYIVLGFALTVPAAIALEIEPRQWSHLPMDINFSGIGYAYTEADIAFDPVLELENVKLEQNTWVAKYIRTFQLGEKSARIDFTQGYQKAQWQGLLQNEPAQTSREGLSDTYIRFAVNLYGAPPLTNKEYRNYRGKNRSDTIIGLGIVLRLPTGDYYQDKLLNLGGNRYVLRPQLGISHRHGNWTTELTSEIAFHGDNNDFYNDSKLEEAPLFITHAHLIYTFKPGVWVSASAGYDYGSETRINNVSNKDTQNNTGWKLSGSYPINNRLGLNFAYLSTRTEKATGADTDSLLASLVYLW